MHRLLQPRSRHSGKSANVGFRLLSQQRVLLYILSHFHFAFGSSLLAHSECISNVSTAIAIHILPYLPLSLLSVLGMPHAQVTINTSSFEYFEHVYGTTVLYALYASETSPAPIAQAGGSVATCHAAWSTWRGTGATGARRTSRTVLRMIRMAYAAYVLLALCCLMQYTDGIFVAETRQVHLTRMTRILSYKSPLSLLQHRATLHSGSDRNMASKRR